MMKRLAKIHWSGDYNEYIDRFAEVATQGEIIEDEELVLWFFTCLPMEIGEKLTHDGTKKFQCWEEAAAALRAWAEPLQAWRARRLRTLQELERLPKRRLGSVRSTNTSTRSIPTGKGRITDESDGIRCYECTGKGHFGRNCPLRNGLPRRRGKICSKCGGKDHYARDCSTIQRTPPEWQDGWSSTCALTDVD
ncbi:hypothetical protein EMH_0089630 [Eimeria mitis]|uniref:CCHC-type domain-containing protein n=1 Tax=Eimeria mitis TaxID=44415 RepID=U6K8M8_9EIME|nr:hypothetical protein EMH_0089630 [Eimeria mitis]